MFIKGGKAPFFEPLSVAVLQPGKTVLMSDAINVWPINETNNTVGVRLKGLTSPIGIAVNQVTQKIYVACNVNNTVTVFSYQGLTQLL